jgi:protein gp37
MLYSDRLQQPLLWKYPHRVFVCSMGDLFHVDVPDEYRMRIWQVMKEADWHQFYILTKRPEEALRFIRGLWDEEGKVVFGEYPDGGRRWSLGNVWMGMSVEYGDHIDRIETLLKIPVARRFVSFEPLLGPVKGLPLEDWHRLDWVIVGGETGPGAYPMDPDWARSIRDKCKDAGVPFFFKKMGSAWKGQIPNDLLIRNFPL